MRSILLVVALSSVVLGCGGNVGAPTTTVGGTVAAATFPAAPTSIQATSGRGAVVRAALDARGAFSMLVPKGDTYSIAIVAGGRRIPLVMPRRSGKLATSFKVSSDGVVIALGAVRYLPAGAKAAFRVASSPGGECRGECVQDDGASTCHDGRTVGGDGENGAECETGVDVRTHAACVDGDVGISAETDGESEMAVPERDAPGEAGGCDDGQEQDGEH